MAAIQIKTRNTQKVIFEYKADNANKVEPKFKVGDWITDGYVGGQITSIEDNYPCYKIADFMGGVNTSIPFSLQDNYHLWTIQDAKDGDVLVCKGNIKYSNGIKYEKICLFNNLDNAFFTLTKLSNFVEEYDIDVRIDYPDNTIPATKEQRDLLMKAMDDAGYTFDFKKKRIERKKELKKVEPKPVTDFLGIRTRKKQ